MNDETQVNRQSGLANGSASGQTFSSLGAAKHIAPASATVSILKDEATGEEVFVKGVGTHFWQSSGDDASNWSNILRSWHPLNFPRFAMARLTGGLTVLESCPNSWDRYEEDSTLAEGLGCNGFRLSMEWSRIEPKQGWIDPVAVQRYRDILDSLHRHNMVPNITLHHFTHTQWFDDIGGFTRPENIQLFVNYAIKVVELFGDQCHLWATFNEPTSSSTMGFVFGAYPPGKMFAFKTAGIVLLNMMRAHTAAYNAIKALPGGDKHKVGVTHMVIPFTSWPDLGPLTAHSRFAARWLTFWWGYDIIQNYFTKGEFSWRVPGLFGDKDVFTVNDPKPPLDWFGVNFYSRPVLSPFLTPGRKPWQIISDLGYPIDPDGLYKVLHRCAEFGVPLYVTETGVSIASQRHRCYMVDSYVKEILHAMTDGVDVRGIYYWTLLDNFEWNGGYGIKFGLYEWSPWPWGKDRAKRDAADTLTDFYRAMPNTVSDVRQFAKKTDLSHPNKAPSPHSIRWWFTNALLLYFSALEMGLEWLGKRFLPQVPIGKYWQKQEYYEQQDLSLGSLLNPKMA